MMGELKSVDVREVYDKKMCRVTIDIPYQSLNRSSVGNMDALEFLNSRVGSEAGINFSMLDDEQDSITGK